MKVWGPWAVRNWKRTITVIIIKRLVREEAGMLAELEAEYPCRHWVHTQSKGSCLPDMIWPGYNSYQSEPMNSGMTQMHLSLGRHSKLYFEMSSPIGTLANEILALIDICLSFFVLTSSGRYQSTNWETIKWRRRGKEKKQNDIII